MSGSAARRWRVGKAASQDTQCLAASSRLAPIRCLQYPFVAEGFDRVHKATSRLRDVAALDLLRGFFLRGQSPL
jgi:hypothetical protein